MEFFASCPMGFETALAAELRALGLPQVRKLKGRVSFGGSPVDAERACLWSRLASRIFLVLARFDCRDADDLYDAVYRVPWEDTLRRGSTIAVSARGTNDRLRNSHFTALRVKDALCDRLADEAGARASVNTEHPDARIALTLRGDRATLSLDLSGEALFRRLPPAATHAGAAHVLRPDYAALALAQIGWADVCAAAEDGPTPLLIDACCAGGGIVLEAAQQLLDRAPGLDRRQWGFSSWTQHDKGAWRALRAEAKRRAAEGEKRPGLIVATDVDAQATALARRVVKDAGIDRAVAFVQADADKVLARVRGAARPGAETRGAIAVDMTEVPFSRMNRALAVILDLYAAEPIAHLPLAAIVRDGLLERELGADPDRAIGIRPNNDEAYLLYFAAEADTAAVSEDAAAGGPVPERAEGGAAERERSAGRERPARRDARATVDLGDGKPVPVLVPESDQFAARLRKVARQRRKWAKRAGVTCYRVYDADLPDYSAAIDLYEGSPATPGRWLVIAEYAAPRSIDPDIAQARMLDMLAIAPRVLDVEPDHVAARCRTRARGGSQYATGGGARRGASRGNGGGGRAGADGDRALPLIQEGGLTFSVNFDDYLDTGIFLDHRITRDLVRTYAKGCDSFLNLFAYTGTATCYAADGGAARTTTVDLSNTYLDWARRNMELNGFTGRAHRFVRADVLGWIAEQLRRRERWDLIFCDPPTFSNSTKMGERTFDVQRDHVELLGDLSRLLTPNGRAIFSCNLRTFRPDREELERAGVSLEDITEQTIPEDFSRNKRIHHCYIVRRLR